MFDFHRWCAWAEVQCRQEPVERVAVELRRGRLSPKQGATVVFETDRKLMQFSFWETGEADFYGVELPSGSDIVGFSGRLLDDTSFERAFGECLSIAASHEDTSGTN